MARMFMSGLTPVLAKPFTKEERDAFHEDAMNILRMPLSCRGDAAKVIVRAEATITALEAERDALQERIDEMKQDAFDDHVERDLRD